MKNKSLSLFLFATLLSGVVLFSGCLKKDDATPASGTPAEQAAANSAGMPEMPKATKEDVMKALEADGFESPEYYAQVKSAVESAQMQIAQQKKDPSLCEKIANEQFKKGCADSLYYQMASEAKDPAKCDKLSDEYTKKSCKSQIVYMQAIEAKDPAKCDGIEDEMQKNSCKDGVVMQKAQAEGNDALCAELKEKPMQDSCKQAVSFAKEEKKRMAEMEAQMKAQTEAAPSVAPTADAPTAPAAQ